MTDIVIVVFGDIGRSPRTQNHALLASSLLAKSRIKAQNSADRTKCDGNVYLIGDSESTLHSSLIKRENVHVVSLWNLSKLSRLKTYIPSGTFGAICLLLYFLLKITVLTVNLLWISLTLLLRLKIMCFLVQTPPLIPCVPFFYLYSTVFDIPLMVDWHNFGYTIMELDKLKRGKESWRVSSEKINTIQQIPKVSNTRAKIWRNICEKVRSLNHVNLIVAIYKKMECYFAKKVPYSFCVSQRMQEVLSHWGSTSAEVLYDRPMTLNQPVIGEYARGNRPAMGETSLTKHLVMSVREKHALLARYDGCSRWLCGWIVRHSAIIDWLPVILFSSRGGRSTKTEINCKHLASCVQSGFGVEHLQNCDFCCCQLSNAEFICCNSQDVGAFSVNVAEIHQKPELLSDCVRDSNLTLIKLLSLLVCDSDTRQNLIKLYAEELEGYDNVRHHVYVDVLERTYLTILVQSFQSMPKNRSVSSNKVDFDNCLAAIRMTGRRCSDQLNSRRDSILGLAPASMKILDCSIIRQFAFPKNFEENLEEGYANCFEDLMRPAFLITSTSWTKDENFDILLNGIASYDNFVESFREYGESCTQLSARTVGSPARLPDLIVLITGKGEMKTQYMIKARSLNLKHVRFRTTFTDIVDYHKFFRCADLGLSVHTSSSGVDLPMKVVDMLGAALPVLCYKFTAIDEQLHDGFNSVLFDCSDSLCDGIVKVLDGFRPKLVDSMLEYSGQCIKMNKRQDDLRFADSGTLLFRLKEYCLQNIPSDFESEWERSIGTRLKSFLDVVHG